MARDMSVGVRARQAIAMFREVRVNLGRVSTQTALPYMTPMLRVDRMSAVPSPPVRAR